VYNAVHHPEVPIRYPMKRIMEDGPFQFWKCDFSALGSGVPQSEAESLTNL
jgi:hypothetical protein